MEEGRSEAYRNALSALQTLCSRRECCSYDIRKKALKLMEGDSDSAESLVEDLKRDSFLDDSRYASAYAREKSAISGWGPAKIATFLRARFIDRSIISAALEELDGDVADSKMVKVMEAKWKLLDGDPYSKFKLIRYALSRGYDYDKVAPVAERLSKKHD